MKKPSKADRNRAIEKIKKCLRLSASDEPNEAAAALRQAQKLMRAFAVTEQDIELSDIDTGVVKTKEAFGGCAYLTRLERMICSIFAVAAVWEPGAGISRKRANIRYYGPKYRVELAVYAHKVIDRNIRNEWAKYLIDNPGKEQLRGARFSFRMAFLTGIEGKVAKLSPTEEEARQIQMWLDAKYGKNVVTTMTLKDRIPEVDFDAYCKGADAALQFEINRPINNMPTGLEFLEDEKP